MTDPITDMLNRIRNAQAVLKETVIIPFSNLKYEVGKILEKEKYIKKIEKKGRKERRLIEIHLKYVAEEQNRQNKVPAIAGLKRVSKPGQRIYTDSKNIRMVRGGYGMAIVSTSKGLMTDNEARKQKLGGEIICQIW